MQMLKDLKQINKRIDECLAYWEKIPDNKRTRTDKGVIESLYEMKKMNEADIKYQEQIPA